MIRRLRASAGRMACGLALTLTLSGCLVGPDYHRPEAVISPGFKELAGWKPGTPQDMIDRGAWWSVYHDPELDRLEADVAISNQSLKATEAAYRQARALTAEASAGLFPTLGLDAGASRSRDTVGSSDGRDLFNLQGQASWDLDVWGKIRRSIESSKASAEASAADLAAARLSLQGLVATDYFQLRGADALQDLLDRTVADYQRSLTIVRNQYNAGTAARSALMTAETQLQTTQAQAVNVGVARAELEHALAVLTGKPPAALSIPAGTLAAIVPELPPGLPSTLLERRPDIAAAERRMQEQNALIGVAAAAYYPDFSLSAAFGYSTSQLGALFTVPSRVWSLGAAASETLFDAGTRSAKQEAAEAAYDESVATYRQTVLVALQGVEDQLSTLRILARQAEIQDKAVASSLQAVEITMNEYRAGTIDYTSVVTAETIALGDQETALTIRQQRLIASAALIQGLGGGWTSADLPAISVMPTQP
jgi:NodT family efflux transporter outer membrane factor (OMF) lipoprotein